MKKFKVLEKNFLETVKTGNMAEINIFLIYMKVGMLLK